LDFDGFVFTLKAPLEECIKRDANRDGSCGGNAAKVVYEIVSKFDYGEIIDTENKTEDEVVNEILVYLPNWFYAFYLFLLEPFDASFLWILFYLPS